MVNRNRDKPKSDEPEIPRIVQTQSQPSKVKNIEPPLPSFSDLLNFCRNNLHLAECKQWYDYNCSREEFVQSYPNKKKRMGGGTTGASKLTLSVISIYKRGK
jgi:hypothetical protein